MVEVENEVCSVLWKNRSEARAGRSGPRPGRFLEARVNMLQVYAGINLTHLYHRSRSCVICNALKGEKPAELPVQLSTKFGFILNLKTAKALGLTVP
jgi:hypothetical protein